MGREETEKSGRRSRRRQRRHSRQRAYPPDTVFLKALDHPEKMVVAIYHDQGLIGFKLVAFETGVNTTLGMPFIRTSPDHGTAFDIAGKGIADPRSMIEALRLAARLTASR